MQDFVPRDNDIYMNSTYFIICECYHNFVQEYIKMLTEKHHLYIYDTTLFDARPCSRLETFKCAEGSKTKENFDKLS